MSGGNFRTQISEVQRAMRESVCVQLIIEYVSVSLFQAFSEFT